MLLLLCKVKEKNRWQEKRTYTRGGRDMTSGDRGRRENDGGDETISSSGGDNDMLEGNEEKK